ncbi:hypothetical protein NPIL_669061 [Nephila pilipes]|uniref:Uncharacterized protein n=1 Tax=Nephila pilipes TaxID=299642 RepID=A0A8X6I6B4_NEPPI|nr:hypothetical protein NPIL_669061 [Nephila pilipes]
MKVVDRNKTACSSRYYPNEMYSYRRCGDPLEKTGSMTHPRLNTLYDASTLPSTYANPELPKVECEHSIMHNACSLK